MSIHTAEDHTLTVVLAFVSSANKGYTRVGVFERRGKVIDWKGEKHEICSSPTVQDVSVAISPEKDVVVAYRLR